jgi:hypothetical protein
MFKGLVEIKMKVLISIYFLVAAAGNETWILRIYE